MKLTLEFTVEDEKLLTGFCSRTGWTEQAGVTREDWMHRQVSSWIGQQARHGAVLAATKPQRDALSVAMQSAISTAATEIA